MTNYYIHKGYIWDYWLVKFAQYLLDDFMFKNLYIYKSYYKNYHKLLSEKLSNKHMKLTQSNIKVINHNINIYVIDNLSEFNKLKHKIKK